MNCPDCILDKTNLPCPNCSKPTYAVDLWGSHPDEGNDDCWTGDDFASLADARIAYDAPQNYFDAISMRSTRFVHIHGEGVDEIRELVGCNVEDDDEWLRERAMQAGMAFGCDGYNDAMGY